MIPKWMQRIPTKYWIIAGFVILYAMSLCASDDMDALEQHLDEKVGIFNQKFKNTNDVFQEFNEKIYALKRTIAVKDTELENLSIKLDRLNHKIMPACFKGED